MTGKQKAAVVGGVVAVIAGAGVAWKVRRSTTVPASGSAVGSQSPSTPGSESVVATATPGVAISAPQIPQLPTATDDAAPTADAGSASATPLFDREVRDPQWAAETEAELGKRLQKIGLAVDSSGCRASTCQLTISATDMNSLGQMAGKLETADGAYGWADHMMLEAVVDKTGRPTQRVFLVFNR
jgi:hypothetical protein